MANTYELLIRKLPYVIVVLFIIYHMMQIVFSDNHQNPPQQSSFLIMLFHEGGDFSVKPCIYLNQLTMIYFSPYNS